MGKPLGIFNVMKQYKKSPSIVISFALFVFIAGCTTKSEFDRKTISQVNIQQNASGLLREIQWQLEAYKYQADWVSNFETERISVIFKRGTHLNGFAGCNALSAKYKATNNLLSVSSINTTRKLCQSRGDIIMQTEANFLANLVNVATYAVDHDTLILFNINGKRILVFKRKEK